MWVSAILFGATVALVAKWIMDRRYRQRTIERLGLPGPEPEFFFGNFKQMREFRPLKQRPWWEWMKKYGKTFGYYEGDTPVIVTSDLEIIKHVLIKNFSEFHSRKPNMLSPSDEAITSAIGDKWKRLRMIVSPTFSARGMKEMSPLVNTSVGELLELREKRAQEGKPFDIMKDFQGLTMAVIAACGFGLDIDAINNPDNIFLKKCQEIFDLASAKSVLMKVIAPLMLIFPRFVKLLVWISHDSFAVPRDWFFNTSARIIEERKAQQETTRRDFVQLMLEAEDRGVSAGLSNLEVSVDQDTVDAPSTSSTTSGGVRGKSMTLSEMQAQCMTFLLAGYETTSTALSFAAYELAMNPDIQKRLQDEISELLPEGKLPDYLSVQRMPHLDRFFNEVLRLHVIAQIILTRKCYDDVTIGDLRIPRDVIVAVHMQGVHKDAEVWGPEDPALFVPDRFLPERKAARPSTAWLPFGAGPRNCLGMRFALMEAKITLTRLLRAYTIVRTEEQRVPLPETSNGIYRPAGGVVVRLEKRTLLPDL